MSDLGHDLRAHVTFGRRKVTPRVCIVDSKQHIRKFLREALEEIGLAAHDCAHQGELGAALRTVVPDLVVLGCSSPGPDVAETIQALAIERFAGKVLLIGAGRSPVLMAAQELGEKLGLAMLPMLETPYRDTDLHRRLAEIAPSEPPPSPPIDVAEALRGGWLELWYQAKLDSRTLLLAGAEALIRMRHPMWGIVPPARFIPGDSDPHFRALSDFVVTRAMADWIYFVTEAAPVRLAVNLPVAFLEDPDSARRLGQKLPDHPAFDGLIVEIRASDMIRDVALAKEVARQLRFYNIGISIDGLGAQWSWLGELDEFPFCELKVGQNFVKGCAADRLKRAACRTAVDFARRFDAVTVAEGVETQEDFHAVQDLGFDLVQGFLFHRPTTVRKFARTVLTPFRAPPAMR
jgi:EAL domain-containing protein (putative c-di-GMP-specific phosphodiesterase class I)/CheY-like chemotaxis protein